MSETSNNRIQFSKPGFQNKYILNVKKVLNLTESGLAQKLGISQRTLREWRKERITVSQVALEKMSQWSRLLIPKDHVVIDWKLHYQKAGRIGAKAKLEKYGNVGGDEKYRKEKWKEWWEKTGQYKNNHPGFQSLIKIKIPKTTKKLAEFAGIMLGDGGVAPYHICITLSSEEGEYKQYIVNLVTDLFGTVPKIHKLKYAKAINIVVQRKELVDFCQEIGLVKGDKIRQKIDIPDWIKDNKNFRQECIRGLIDTDGCFYTNSYFVNGKKYSYFKIAFTSASVPLIDSVAKILRDFGINARISKNHRDVRIEGVDFVNKYIKEIGSHNQKHLDKIKQWNASRLR